MKRGIKKAECVLVNVWVPKVIMPYLDKAVALEDTDRSKFVRNALRDKMRKQGVPVPDQDGLTAVNHTDKKD